MIIVLVLIGAVIVTLLASWAKKVYDNQKAIKGVKEIHSLIKELEGVIENERGRKKSS